MRSQPKLKNTGVLSAWNSGVVGRGGRALEQRHLEIHPTAGSDHPEQLGQRLVGVGHVFEHVRGEHHVDSGIRQVDLLQVELDVAAVRLRSKSLVRYENQRCM